MTEDTTILVGRYSLGETIGYGGMGEVHRGRDIRIGREVAIKLLRADLARDPSFLSRFRREAQAAAALNSPSIVAVFDTGEGMVRGVMTPYIVMEYVAGRTLKDVITSEGRLTPTRALAVASPVCGALATAHAAGIVHRDIKPANVMVTDDGRVKVMDFGIARALTANVTMTQTAAIVGTANYLSPEQARGEVVGASSDIYSMGCLLYELLTGSPPFTGESAVAVAYQHVREDPTPPSHSAADVPPAVDAIVLVALAKDPADRYPTADAMRADIERARAGDRVTAVVPARSGPTAVTTITPSGPTGSQTRAPRRRGLIYLVLVAATVAVFVGVLLLVRHLVGGQGSDINNPDVVGQPLAQAQEQLTDEGLKIGAITYSYTGKKDQGRVISENPPADILLHSGQSVALVVSNGIRYVVVPGGLDGLTESQAKAALATAGLTVGHVVSRNSPAMANQVLEVTPTAGSRVPAGTSVTLYVSNAQVKVPNVTGKTVSEATAILEQAGFQVDSKTSATYVPHADGTIISQSPAGKTYVKQGSLVTIYADGPAPVTSPSPNPSLSNSPGTSPSPTDSGSTSPTPSLNPTPTF